MPNCHETDNKPALEGAQLRHHSAADDPRRSRAAAELVATCRARGTDNITIKLIMTRARFEAGFEQLTLFANTQEQDGAQANTLGGRNGIGNFIITVCFDRLSDLAKIIVLELGEFTLA